MSIRKKVNKITGNGSTIPNGMVSGGSIRERKGLEVWLEEMCHTGNTRVTYLRSLCSTHNKERGGKCKCVIGSG